jgi:hypothetical protein
MLPVLLNVRLLMSWYGGIKKIPLSQSKLIEMLTKQIGQMFEALALKNK